jgi:molecular chaperone HscB
MKLTDDDFRLFGLPQKFDVERSALDTRWRELQSRVHPDRFAADGASSQRLAMQWSVRVNEAYRRLRDPLARAAYLCELRGAPIEAENNTAMPREFLMHQLAWREALDEAGDITAVQALDNEVARFEEAAMTELQDLLDDRGDAVAAASQVRALMFVTRFRADIDRRLDALGQ